MKHLIPFMLISLTACQSGEERAAKPDPSNPQANDPNAADAWDAPSTTGPILVGTVHHPDGHPLEGIEVTQHSGLATRFRGSSTRTDAAGRFRFSSVEGTPMPSSDGGSSELYVGVSVGSVRNVNPPSVIPWKDIRVVDAEGVVARLEFEFDPESVPVEFRD